MARCILFVLLFLYLPLWADNGRQCVLYFALGEVGVTEATGHNDGEVEKYLRYVGLKKGDPYCAAYCSWVYAQECLPNPRSGWSPSWFPQDKVVYEKGREENTVVQQGDVFGIYFKDKGRIAHVGMIIDMNNQWVTTVEANTSPDKNEGEATREGDGVFKKKRLKSQIYKVANWID